MKIYMVCPVT